MRTICLPSGVLGVLVLPVAVLAGCGSPPAAPAVPPPSVSVPSASVPPSSAPPAAPSPFPADGADVSACGDGTCQIEIRGRVDVPLAAFGLGRWRITPDPDGVAWEIRPGDAVRQVNGGTGGRSGSTDDAAAGAVRPEVGEVFAGGLVMRLVESDGKRAVVEFRRGAPTVPG